MSYGDEDAPWEPEVMGVQSEIHQSEDERSYNERHGIRSMPYLTIVRPEHADWIVERLGERFVDKTVVEIGAGVGVLATRLATSGAKRVYAIEASPGWSWVFVRYLYKTKPTNLTWIFDAAESLVGVLRADLAIVVTGSDEERLRELARAFAPDVCLPWQDWNEGKAVVPSGPLPHAQTLQEKAATMIDKDPRFGPR